MRSTGQRLPAALSERRTEPKIDVQHCANSVAHMANLPLDANVLPRGRVKRVRVYFARLMSRSSS